MLIYFVRHGQTDYNVQGIIQGHLDTPLNDTGRHEAALLRDAIRDVEFSAAWSSPLSRAMETSQILTAPHPGLTIQTHLGMKERDLGSLSGHRWTRGTPLPADVESGPEFRTRVSTWFADFLAAHESSPDATVLVISHGAYLSALLGVLLSPPYSLSTKGVDLGKHCLNTCVMRVKVTFTPKPCEEREGGEGGGEGEWEDVSETQNGTLAENKKKPKSRGKWTGRILTWGDAEHLGDHARDIGVADDLRQSMRQVEGLNIETKRKE